MACPMPDEAPVIRLFLPFSRINNIKASQKSKVKGLLTFDLPCLSSPCLTRPAARHIMPHGASTNMMKFLPLALAAFAAALPAQVQVDPDDIGGVVTSAKGPEAGVWVIAETT